MAAGVAAAAVNEKSSVIDELYDVHSQFRGIVAEKLVLSHRQLFNHPPLGFISHVRIVIEIVSMLSRLFLETFRVVFSF